MHELSLCEAIARKVVERAAGRRVLAVTIRVGHLRQAVPDAMAFAWEMLTATTSLEGAQLEIEQVPATIACNACASVTTLDIPVFACAMCGSRDVALRSGDELLLVSLETADEPALRGEAH